MRAAAGKELDARRWEQSKARVTWVKETIEAWREAQREMDERCGEAVDCLGEAAFNRLFEAEQAKVAAILLQLRAVIDHDRWPPHLRFGDV